MNDRTHLHKITNTRKNTNKQHARKKKQLAAKPTLRVLGQLRSSDDRESTSRICSVPWRTTAASDESCYYNTTLQHSTVSRTDGVFWDFSL